MRADGTAASVAAATGPVGTQANCMNVAVHNADSGTDISAGDTIVVADDGGDYDSTITPPTSGSVGSVITYINSGTPVLKGSDIVPDVWSVDSGSRYKTTTTITTEPEQIWVDGDFGDRKASAAACTANLDWYWAGNILYLYSSGGDPYTTYTTPGIEIGQREYCFSSTNKDYVTVDGLFASQANHSGFHADNCDYYTHQNCIGEWNWQYGFNIKSASPTVAYTDATIQDCIGRYNGVAGVSANGSTTNYLMRRCKLYENGNYQMADPYWEGKHAWTSGFKAFANSGNPVSNMILEQNEVYDNGHATIGSAHGLWLDAVSGSAGRNYLRYNYTHGNRGAGIWFEHSDHNTAFGNLSVEDAAVAGNGAIKIKVGNFDPSWLNGDYNFVYNNTIVDAGTYGIYHNLTNNTTWNSESNYCEFKNNIVTGSGAQEVYIDTWSPAGEYNDGSATVGNRWANNCFGAAGAGLARVQGSNYTTYDTFIEEMNVSDGSTMADNNEEAEPSFNNAGADEYWLASDSGCIDAGANLGVTYDDCLNKTSSWTDSVSTLDQDDHGSGWDMGAYVYDVVANIAKVCGSAVATIEEVCDTAFTAIEKICGTDK